MRLRILNCGCYELFKAGVHGTALGLAAVMGLYNAAAWLRRREPHLAVNAILYGALTAWEHQHVTHHLRGRAPASEPAETAAVSSAGSNAKTIAEPDGGIPTDIAAA